MHKTPLKSKKFIAYLISDIGWKLVIFYVLYKQSDNIQPTATTLLLALAFVNGFMQAGYILGQAALDRYVQMTEAAYKKDKSEDTQ